MSGLTKSGINRECMLAKVCIGDIDHKSGRGSHRNWASTWKRDSL
jgi:hypothetical protein